MSRGPLSGAERRLLGRVVCNPGRTTAVPWSDHRRAAEGLVSRGLVRWVVRDGFATDYLEPTRDGARIVEG